MAGSRKTDSSNSQPNKEVGPAGDRRVDSRAKGKRTRRGLKGNRFSPGFKAECLRELAQGKAPSQIAKDKKVSEMSLWRWREAALSRAGRSEKASSEPVSSSPSQPAYVAGPASHPIRENPAGFSDKEVEEILKLKKEHFTMGPAQIRAQLKRFHGWRMSNKAIARVLKANGYRVEHRSAREEQEALQRFEAPRPNALWQMDALSLRVHEQRLYLHLVIDDFSRFITGHRLSEDITSEEALATLQAAIAAHGKPERLLTDRGGQFLAVRGETAFRRFLEKELIDHSVSRPYHPQTLGKVESVNRSIQKELIYLHEFRSAEEARVAIGAWVERYNFKRAHMGIDGVTPADRYFGLHRRVLAELQARSSQRQTALALDVPRGGAVEEISGALEVLRLVLADGQIELRFCGQRFALGKAQG